MKKETSKSDKVNKKSKTKSNKKTGILHSIVKYFGEVKSELKKVKWLNRKQLINSTIVVLLSCLFCGVIIWAVDGVAGLLRNLIYKL